MEGGFLAKVAARKLSRLVGDARKVATGLPKTLRMDLNDAALEYMRRARVASTAGAAAEADEKQHEDAMLLARGKKMDATYTQMIALGMAEAVRQKLSLDSEHTLKNYKSRSAFFNYAARAALLGRAKLEHLAPLLEGRTFASLVTITTEDLDDLGLGDPDEAGAPARG